MKCPCEACKMERGAAAARRAGRRAAAEANAAWHKRQLQDIEGRINASKDAKWVTGRGEHIRVQAMNGAHLFYAIAKGYRGEYPTHTQMAHLENEALRRLIARVS